MAELNHPSSSEDTASSPSSEPSMKESLSNADSMITELAKSHSEIVARIQRLKQEMQSWKLKLDTQVKTYKDELVGLKATINNDFEQLSSEFQGITVTLRQQQEDMTDSLKMMENISNNLEERESPMNGAHQRTDDGQVIQKHAQGDLKEPES